MSLAVFSAKMTFFPDLRASKEGFLKGSRSGSERQSCRLLYRLKTPNLLLSQIPCRQKVMVTQTGQKNKEMQNSILSQILTNFGSFGHSLEIDKNYA